MDLFLDTQTRLLSAEVLFMRSVDSAPVYTRVVAFRALAYHATSVAVAHNHPQGALTASNSDSSVNQILPKALLPLDHFIAGKGRCASLRNSGFVKHFVLLKG